jgi:acetyltransferase-like isoleucine patch superfamily enzyme
MLEAGENVNRELSQNRDTHVENFLVEICRNRKRKFGETLDAWEPRRHASTMHRGLGNLLYTAWDLFWIRMDCACSTLRSITSLLVQGCPPGPDFRTTGRCSFKARRAGSIQIGSSVRFLADWRSNRAGLANPVLLQTFGEGVIRIGNSTGGSSVVISSRTSIQLGQQINLGANVRIFDHDFHALDPAMRRLPLDEQAPHIRSEPVELGDDVFVGANAIILKGARLGARSIVAAGAVVFRGEYPEGSLLVGNPAMNRRGLK